MIIAWAFFIIGTFATLLFITIYILEYSKANKKKYRQAVSNFWFWLIITICSAQYIWG